MKTLRYLAIAGVLSSVMLSPVSGVAQDAQTLADIRQEINVLSVELKKLVRELSTSGASGNADLSGTLLQRTDAAEAELQRLTALTEQIQLRVNNVIKDGNTRIGDLEFRVCELEPGCDIGALGESKPLGGAAPETATAQPTPSPEPTNDGPQLAAAEQGDFDRAKASFDAGDFAAAATGFAKFNETYPGSPLSGQAGLMRGEALAAQGDQAGAARAWLETFSAAPNGDQAPEAVLRLGRALGKLGKTNEACLTLGDIATRYPGTPQVAAAESEMQTLGCQ